MLKYIALDYKVPPHKFKAVTGVDTYAAFSQTLDLLYEKQTVPFKECTTIHTDFLNEDDSSVIIRRSLGR